jgi:hypothetical protein
MEPGDDHIQNYLFRDGFHCIGEICSRLVGWSNRQILEFDPKSGAIKAWWIEDQG